VLTVLGEQAGDAYARRLQELAHLEEGPSRPYGHVVRRLLRTIRPGDEHPYRRTSGAKADTEIHSRRGAARHRRDREGGLPCSADERFERSGGEHSPLLPSVPPSSHLHARFLLSAGAFKDGREVEVVLVAPEGGWPIAGAAAAMGVTLPEAAAKSLSVWLHLLATWNARVDLTAARSSDELVDLMIADALVLSTRIPEGARVVDVGTGAGAPGLALAIIRGDLTVTLVEPLSKRSAFLRTVIGSVGLPRLSLEPRRGEEVARSHSKAWDVALARATLAPAPWLDLAADLVTDEGSAWVFLAKEPSPTGHRFSPAPSEEVTYEWPLTHKQRRLARYTRGGARPGG
jgi:16S rRNA (guanine527-N7)-methyltransferase